MLTNEVVSFEQPGGGGGGGGPVSINIGIGIVGAVNYCKTLNSRVSNFRSLMKMKYWHILILAFMLYYGSR